MSDILSLPQLYVSKAMSVQSEIVNLYRFDDFEEAMRI